MPKRAAPLLMICCAILVHVTSGHAQTASHREAPAQSVLQRADSLYFQSEWKAAAGQYVRYLSDTSTNSLAWNRLGYSNHKLGNYPEALKDFEKALANHPNSTLKPVVESRMARVYAKMDQHEQSLDWMDRAVNSGYVNLTEMDTCTDFDGIRQEERFRVAYKKVFAGAYPCSNDPKSRSFDFWIGEWDVYQTGTKIMVGHSIVQNVAGGCALLENWTSTQASNGKSINYIDPENGKWEQDWIGSSGGPQRFLKGDYRDNAMRFVYESNSNGTKTTGNFIFYNIGPNEVRQFQDMSTDGGKTFQTSYDFTYIRRASSPGN